MTGCFGACCKQSSSRLLVPRLAFALDLSPGPGTGAMHCQSWTRPAITNCRQPQRGDKRGDRHKHDPSAATHVPLMPAGAAAGNGYSLAARLPQIPASPQKQMQEGWQSESPRPTASKALSQHFCFFVVRQGSGRSAWSMPCSQITTGYRQIAAQSSCQGVLIPDKNGHCSTEGMQFERGSELQLSFLELQKAQCWKRVAFWLAARHN